MFELIANNAYVFWIIVCVFFYLYHIGGDDIVFFRKKQYDVDPKASEKLTDALNKFTRSRDFAVMGATTIEVDGVEHSFDALLFTYAGVTAFSLQPQIGETYAELTSEEWATIWNGSRTTFANPLLKMEDNEKLFREIFRKEGVKYGKSQNMVVFTNDKANVVASRTVPVCHVNDLDKKLAEKCLNDNGANIEGMKAAIEKYKK